MKEELKSIKASEILPERNFKAREQKLLLSLEKLTLSSRVDTLALSEWIAKMAEDISKEKEITDHERFELYQYMYNISFIELSKQVSIQCIERGTLLN